MAESHRYLTRASLRGRIDQGREGLSHDVFRESDTSTPAPLAQPEDVRIGPSISESRISSDEETAGADFLRKVGKETQGCTLCIEALIVPPMVQ